MKLAASHDSAVELTHESCKLFLREGCKGVYGGWISSHGSVLDGSFHLITLVEAQGDIESLPDAVNIDQVFGLPLLLDEVVIRDTEAAQEQDDAPIEEARAKGTASDHVEGEVGGRKLGLTLPKLDLPSLELRLDHDDALSSRQSDLKGTYLRKPELFRRL